MKHVIRLVLVALAGIAVFLAIFIPLNNRSPKEAYLIIRVGDCEYIQFINGQILHSAVCPNPKHDEMPGRRP